MIHAYLIAEHLSVNVSALADRAMPAWLFDKRDLRSTPSAIDGIDTLTENKYRREGARLIIDVGADLNLRYDTVATGCVYFHRFFMLHSFKEFNRFVTAIGCLFLAGKVEETPKKCRDLLRVARPRLSDQQFDAFGDDPREEVMTIERVLLQTIKFDLQVEHPYQFLIKYAKVLQGNKTSIENMVQMAWTFINDSLCTTICLQWEAEVVAIALMYLASRLSKCPINDWTNRRHVDGEKWWDQYVEHLGLDVLEDICHQVLDLYSTQGGVPGAPPSVPTATRIQSQPTTPLLSNGNCATSAQPSPSATFGVSSATATPISSVAGAANQQPLIRRDSTKLPASSSGLVQQHHLLQAPQPSTSAPSPMPPLPQRFRAAAPATQPQRSAATNGAPPPPLPPAAFESAAYCMPYEPNYGRSSGYIMPAMYGRAVPASSSATGQQHLLYAPQTQPPSNTYGRPYGRTYDDGTM